MKLSAVPILLAALLPSRLDAQPVGSVHTPVLVPTRDVDITYRITEGRSERMRWQISAQRLRVDPPVAGTYILLDMPTQHLSFVRLAQRAVTDTTSGLPVPKAGPAGFTARGSAEVAGLTCTEWATPGPAGTETLSCLTDDGVLLRSRIAHPDDKPPTDHGLLLEATAVTFGPLDPNLFVIPPDFTHTTQDATPP